MRSFVILLISVFFFCSTAYAEYDVKPWEKDYDILKDEEASAWLKTRNWPQEIIDEWVRISALPNGLSLGLDNPLCHIYADENDLIAGREGLGKYPENPKEIIPVEWKEYPEEDGIKRSITMFDVNNNGTPLVLERTVADNGSWRAGFYKGIHSFSELDALRKKEGDKVYDYRTRFINELAVCDTKPYDGFSTISFFTYDDESYIKIRCYGPSDYQDVIARYDNGIKKRVCVYEGYGTYNEKELDTFKKRFSLSSENMQTALAEKVAFYLRGTGSVDSIKYKCSAAKHIGKKFVALFNSRLSSKYRCPEDLSKIVRNVAKLTKKVKNGVTLYLDEGKAFGTLWTNDTIIDPNGNIIGRKQGNNIIGLDKDVIGIIENEQDTEELSNVTGNIPEESKNKIVPKLKWGSQKKLLMKDGKFFGTLTPDQTFVNTNGYVIGLKRGNKIVGVSGEVIFIIEED